MSKYVIGAAIKNAGNPGRRFLAASPLCALALKLLKLQKLLKPTSCAGYVVLGVGRGRWTERPHVSKSAKCPKTFDQDCPNETFQKHTILFSEISMLSSLYCYRLDSRH